MKSHLPSIDLRWLRANLKPGDVLGFNSRSWVSDCINLGSYGIPRYSISHLGIIGHHPDYDNLIYQSCYNPPLFYGNHGTPAPCVIQKKIVNGTQAQGYETLINYPGKVWWYRLHLPLRNFETDMLSIYLNGTIGRPYDRPGAFEAGGHLIANLMSWWHPECTASFFCSEWVAAAYRQIERFDTDSVSRWSPNAFLRECRRRAIHLKPVRIV